MELLGGTPYKRWRGWAPMSGGAVAIPTLLEGWPVGDLGADLEACAPADTWGSGGQDAGDWTWRGAANHKASLYWHTNRGSRYVERSWDELLLVSVFHVTILRAVS